MSLNELLLGAIIISFFVAVLYAIQKFQQNKAEFIAQIDELEDSFTSSTPGMQAFQQEIQTTLQHQKLAQDVEEKAKSLSFPQLEPIDNSASGNTIVEKLGKTFDPNAPVFAGAEQVILMIIPPDQVIDCLEFTAQMLGQETMRTFTDSLPVLKSSLAEGIQNLHQHEVVIKCLHELGQGLWDHLTTPGTGLAIAEAQHDGAFKLLRTIIDPDAVLARGLDPAFHVHHHLDKLKGIAQHHAGHLVHASHAHAAHTLHATAGAHFPYLTVIFSSVREINLLSSQKTSLETSLKNIALDTVGTGLGAVAGGKIGAAAGLVFGPIGSLIGGALGAIAGGIGGRKATDSYKYSDLKAAMSAYQSSYSSMESDLRRTAQNSYTVVQTTIADQQAAYLKALDTDSRPVVYFQKSRDSIQALFHTLSSEYTQAWQKINELQQSALYRMTRAGNRLDELEAYLLSIQQSIPRKVLNPLELSQQLATIRYPANGLFDSQLPEVTQQLRAQNDQFMTGLMAYTYRSALLYREANSQIVVKLNEEAVHYDKNAQSWKSILLSRKEVVDSERQKLGL